MGLGSHMAQEDPGREEKEKRDKQCIPENTAYTSSCLLCELPSRAQPNSTLGSTSSEGGILGF